MFEDDEAWGKAQNGRCFLAFLWKIRALTQTWQRSAAKLTKQSLTRNN